MPKAVKERPKHSASLTAQLQNDRSPLVSDSKRAKRKRKADEDTLDKDDVISGKQSRQILVLAREQQDETQDNHESEGEEELRWREGQMYCPYAALIVEMRERILTNTPMKRNTRSMTQKRSWYGPWISNTRALHQKTEDCSVPSSVQRRSAI
jgi:hypothetical protein